MDVMKKLRLLLMCGAGEILEEQTAEVVLVKVLLCPASVFLE
jgi:hypothetical protein